MQKTKFMALNVALKRIFLILFVCVLSTAIFTAPSFGAYASTTGEVLESEMGLAQNSTIKWVDLNVSSRILKDVYRLNVKHHNTAVNFDFVEVLAYIATKNGNKFSYNSDKKTLSKLNKELESGKTVAELIGDNKYYRYYLACYDAVFKEYVGEYVLENDETKTVHYGLKAYFPLAKGHWFNHYDDFGSSRSYGFKRIHLGHDLMGSTGAPVVAIEGGTIEEMGWNRYGGWRIGIRSFDKKRYYYYAHLRKGHPFAHGLKTGGTVDAGSVIGYLGMTGYSTKEDANLKSGKPHLHWGLQLIFDEGAPRESNNEIWVDVYALSDFLLSNRAQTVKTENKECKSINLRSSPRILKESSVCAVATPAVLA